MSQPAASLAAWRALEAHHRETAEVQMRDLFAADPSRFDHYSLSAAGLFLDYSKNRINAETMRLLRALAEAVPLEQRRQALFAGEPVNPTEGRAALHTAMRLPSGESQMHHGEDIMPEVREVQRRINRFAEAVRDGSWTGHSGKRITDVVNIGIGGSDLGPLMAIEALKPFVTREIAFHFVSNVDGSHLAMTLRDLDPESTLFIIASKTFTTIETITNAVSARNWLLDSGADQSAIARHFVALSTNAAEVQAFGIDTDNMFGFWDFIGGRYSVWSAIGLSLVIAIGPERFRQFLDGGHAMDVHFRDAPLDQNMPVILALLTVWYTNFFCASSHLIAPYDQLLHRFPAYLQQLTMESNGKSVQVDGTPVFCATEPVVWGEPGTNGQHAFFQLLHQGTHLIPTDFIVPLESLNPLEPHHELLLANCLAQSKALMRGKTVEEVEAEMRASGIAPDRIALLKTHRHFVGNRPSNTIMATRFDPAALGALIALYEHKIFTEAAIWNINPFDQWGVELGKVLATELYEQIHAGHAADELDSSTRGLLQRVIRQRTLLA